MTWRWVKACPFLEGWGSERFRVWRWGRGGDVLLVYHQIFQGAKMLRLTKRCKALVDNTDRLEHKNSSIYPTLKQTALLSGSFLPLYFCSCGSSHEENSISYQSLLSPSRFYPSFKVYLLGKLSDLSLYQSLSSTESLYNTTQHLFFEVIANSQNLLFVSHIQRYYDLLVIIPSMQIQYLLIAQEFSLNKNNLCILKVESDVLYEFPSAFSSGQCAQKVFCEYLLNN